MSFSVTVDDSGFKRKAAFLLRELGTSGMRGYLKAVGLLITNRIAGVFDTEGASGEGKWRALTSQTIARRRKGQKKGASGGLRSDKILQDRGILRASMTGKGNAKGKAYHINDLRTGFFRGYSIRVGSHLDYAATHQHGRGGIPARPMLPKDKDIQQDAIKLMDARLARIPRG